MLVIILAISFHWYFWQSSYLYRDTYKASLHNCESCFFVHAESRVFGMQVGCGIDHEKYAFNYAKAGAKPAIGCGVVIGGHTAIAVPMQLEKYGKKSKFK